MKPGFVVEMKETFERSKRQTINKQTLMSQKSKPASLPLIAGVQIPENFEWNTSLELQLEKLTEGTIKKNC
jgi:hypothetical protein